MIYAYAHFLTRCHTSTKTQMRVIAASPSLRPKLIGAESDFGHALRVIELADACLRGGTENAGLENAGP